MPIRISRRASERDPVGRWDGGTVGRWDGGTVSGVTGFLTRMLRGWRNWFPDIPIGGCQGSHEFLSNNFRMPHVNASMKTLPVPSVHPSRSHLHFCIAAFVACLL